MYKNLLTTEKCEFKKMKLGFFYLFFYVCKCFSEKYNIHVDFSFKLETSHKTEPTKDASFIIYHDKLNEENELGRGFYQIKLKDDYQYSLSKSNDVYCIYYSEDDREFTKQLFDAMKNEKNIYIEKLMTIEEKYRVRHVLEFGL